MRTRLALTSGLAFATLFALSGCFAGPGGTGPGEGTTGGEVGSGGTAECLEGSWTLDDDAVARDLGAYMAENGMVVTSSTSTGGVHLTVSGDRMTWVSDVTYSMVVDLGDGITMDTHQLHVGESSGNWALEEDWVVFSGWESDVIVTNTVLINGVESTTPIDIPADDGSGVALVVSCDGDLLTTQPDGSPITSVWFRE
jgi:hypothetical protein